MAQKILKKDCVPIERNVMKCLEFTSDDGEVLSFFVLEETRINSVNYLLVSESEDEEAECYILKDVSDAKDKEAVYEFVEEDEELNSIGEIFEELWEDS